jgi:uncharacterized protein
MPGTLITSEVDFDTDGTAHGFLRLPHSVHRSAYGWIPIPVVSIRNGDGPTLLLMAGNHGDEYEGQVALSCLIRELRPSDIRGRLIVLPQTNAPAAGAGTRVSPLDQGNLNRAFPGDPRGSPTQMIAHYIEEALLPLCDFMIDLHSGGSSLWYPPTLLRGTGHSPEEAAKLILLQEAFDLPYAWIFASGSSAESTGRTALAAANRKGVTSVLTELGGGGVLTPDILGQTMRGLRRVLHALDMLPAYQPDAPRGTRQLNARGLVYAYDAGLFELIGDVGDMVQMDQEIGLIHFPDSPWRNPVSVTTPHGGMILCKRSLAQVVRGDALVQIATDAD